jgi:peptidoglycan-N-acetylglucosamine deacetylase
MKLAGLSCDVDSVTSHLEGYGFPRPSDDGAAYTVAVPRILELLAREGARATFFLIADEARCYPDAVARITDEGHEVASHSMTHRVPFGLNAADREVEISGSKALLEDLTGQEVVGFRAPSWDAGPWLAKELAAAGYRYDGSGYPSILLPFLRAAVRRRGMQSNRRPGTPVWSIVFGPAGLHRIETEAGSLIEVPMCTVPWLRLPYYHTLRFVLPGWLFRMIRRLAHQGRGSVWYQFHAVDFLSVSADRLDPRVACHPGMQLALDRKLRFAAEAVQSLGHGRFVVPLRELVTHRFGALTPAARVTREVPA